MRSALFAAMLAAAPALAAAQEPATGWTWGTAVGWPQTMALTAERHGASAARLQIHAGTFFVASSVAARGVFISPTRGFAPYAFLGAGLLHVAEGEGGGGTGLTGFAWGGAGLRIPTGPLRWFVEVGIMGGMDSGKGYDSTTPSGAIGVAFGR